MYHPDFFLFFKKASLMLISSFEAIYTKKKLPPSHVENVRKR